MNVSRETAPAGATPGGLRASTFRAGKVLAGVAAFLGAISFASPAYAQISAGTQSPLGLVVLLAILGLLPFLLTMVTSFVKIAVVLSLLRTAIGVQQAPPNQVITGLSIVLSIYIMAPVGMEIYDQVAPYMDSIQSGEFDGNVDNYTELATTASKPLKAFLLKHADETERELLYNLALQLRTPEQQAKLKPDDLIIAIPAFVLTELKEAFMIGFILFVPFIIVDMVVANILLSLGMHMLSPTTVSLPFKLLLFVLVDGWYLVIKGLILGYV